MMADEAGLSWQLPRAERETLTAVHFENMTRDLKYLEIPSLLKNLAAALETEYPELDLWEDDQQDLWEDVTVNTFESLPPERQYAAAVLLNTLFTLLSERGYRLVLAKIVYY